MTSWGQAAQGTQSAAPAFAAGQLPVQAVGAATENIATAYACRRRRIDRFEDRVGDPPVRLTVDSIEPVANDLIEVRRDLVRHLKLARQDLGDGAEKVFRCPLGNARPIGRWAFEGGRNPCGHQRHGAGHARFDRCRTTPLDNDTRP